MTHIRLVISLLVMMTLLQLPLLHDWTIWTRAGISEGQWWRILSGNFTHTNHWHLLMNSVALASLAFIFRRYTTPWHMIAVLSIASFAIGIVEWLGNGQWYAGISGALHGLFAFGAVQDWRHGDRLGKWLVVGVIAKVAYELWFGGSATTASLIGARVAVEAHAVGTAIGLILAIIPATILRR